MINNYLQMMKLAALALDEICKQLGIDFGAPQDSDVLLLTEGGQKHPFYN